VADHPIDPRDFEPFGDRAFDHRDDKYHGEVHNRTCKSCPGEGGLHKLSCPEAGGQLKLPATVTPEGAVRVTLSGKPPEPGSDGTGAPAPIDPRTGQHKDYWVLSAEERAKGFVEPVRKSYKHVGISGPKPGTLRDLTPEEHERYSSSEGWVKYETYPKGHPTAAKGRFWSQENLDKVGKGCGTVTTMGSTLAETYARQPEFYGSTFCCGCGTHLPVGRDGEFVWEGTLQRVGTRAPKPTPENWEPTVALVPAMDENMFPGEPPLSELEEGWKPYVPEPLKDVSALLASYAENKNKLTRATIILEYEGVGIVPATIVLKAEEGTALLCSIDARNGIAKPETGPMKLSPTGESDFKLEIHKRKIP
jgi:hypothetical protein